MIFPFSNKTFLWEKGKAIYKPWENVSLRGKIISIPKINCYGYDILGSLSSDVFERRTSTGSGLFALLSRNFDQIFGQIVSIRVKKLSNTNMVASRLIKREKGSLPVDVRRSKTSLLKLPNSLPRRRS